MYGPAFLYSNVCIPKRIGSGAPPLYSLHATGALRRCGSTIQKMEEALPPDHVRAIEATVFRYPDSPPSEEPAKDPVNESPPPVILRSYIHSVVPSDDFQKPRVPSKPTVLMEEQFWDGSLCIPQMLNNARKSSKHEKAAEGNKYIYERYSRTIVRGCEHYPMDAKVACPECGAFYFCRICHNDAEDHEIDRFRLSTMQCMFCNEVGRIGSSCDHCGRVVAQSFCSKCNYISNFGMDTRPFFHCDGCGFCRIGLKGEYTHCDECSLCYKNEFFKDHLCQKQEMKCIICMEDLKCSIYAHTEIGCGNKHFVHVKCLDGMIRNGVYTCPLCKKYVIAKRGITEITRAYDRFLLIGLSRIRIVKFKPLRAKVPDASTENSVHSTASEENGEETNDSATESSEQTGEEAATGVDEDKGQAIAEILQRLYGSIGDERFAFEYENTRVTYNLKKMQELPSQLCICSEGCPRFSTYATPGNIFKCPHCKMYNTAAYGDMNSTECDTAEALNNFTTTITEILVDFFLKEGASRRRKQDYWRSCFYDYLSIVRLFTRQNGGCSILLLTLLNVAVVCALFCLLRMATDSVE